MIEMWGLWVYDPDPEIRATSGEPGWILDTSHTGPTLPIVFRNREQAEAEALERTDDDIAVEARRIAILPG